MGRAYEGVRSLLTAVGGPRECLGTRDDSCEARGVVSALLIDIRDLVIWRAGVVATTGIDLSEEGGEGGVGVSETFEDSDFVGGVATVGEEADVVGE